MSESNRITNEFLQKLGRSAELREKVFFKTISGEEAEEYYKLKEYFMDWFLK